MEVKGFSRSSTKKKNNNTKYGKFRRKSKRENSRARD